MLIGVRCVCVHRGEYIRVYMSVYVYTVFLNKQKRTDILIVDLQHQNRVDRSLIDL
jgi:hypothetical protein